MYRGNYLSFKRDSFQVLLVTDNKADNLFLHKMLTNFLKEKSGYIGQKLNYWL